MSHLEESYRLLEVGPDASAEEIRAAYLTLVSVWHPDRFAHDPRLQARAVEKLKGVNRAFEAVRTAPLSRGVPLPPLERTPMDGASPREAPAGRSAEEWFQVGHRLAIARVEIRPGETLAWSNIADMNRHLEGIRAFQEAVRLRPDFAEAWYQMGVAHAQFHQFREAATAFGEAARLRPDHAPAWINLGAALGQLERHPEVIHAFRQAVRIQPRDASAWYTLAVVHAHPRVREYAEAVEACREALRLRPELAEAWHVLGRVRLEHPEAAPGDDARDALTEAVRLKPDLAAAWSDLGEALLAAGQPDDAVRALRQALQLEPERVDAWRRLGAATRAGRRPDAAREVEEVYANLRRLDRAEAARFLETLPRHQRFWLAWRSDRTG